MSSIVVGMCWDISWHMTYRLFVQVRHAGRIVTGAFDARVD
ncbi:MAG TPA: hypothetical protein VHT91_42520 [Kofleriaceae bacterium]|nr:hypothetical protein [Kofleriaceae bacterium]